MVLTKRIEKLENAIELEEKHERKNNVVLKFLEITSSEVNREMEKFFKHYMNINAKIQGAFTLNKDRQKDIIFIKLVVKT